MNLLCRRITERSNSSAAPPLYFDSNPRENRRPSRSSAASKLSGAHPSSLAAAAFFGGWLDRSANGLAAVDLHPEQRLFLFGRFHLVGLFSLGWVVIAPKPGEFLRALRVAVRPVVRARAEAQMEIVTPILSEFAI